MNIKIIQLTLCFKVLYMNTNQHLENLSEIRNIMERSTKFISLSGLSGVSAGIIALIGSYIAYVKINSYGNERQEHILNMTEESSGELFILGIAILVFALIFGSLFTLIKAKKRSDLVWNSISKKLLINMSIPLFSGGIFCLALMQHGYFGLIAPTTLIFYGLGCINASHHTLSDIRYLGLCNLALGLVNLFFIGYGLLFWAMGFGVLHIVYGTIMYIKYDMKKV